MEKIISSENTNKGLEQKHEKHYLHSYIHKYLPTSSYFDI